MERVRPRKLWTVIGVINMSQLEAGAMDFLGRNVAIPQAGTEVCEISGLALTRGNFFGNFCCLAFDIRGLGERDIAEVSEQQQVLKERALKRTKGEDSLKRDLGALG